MATKGSPKGITTTNNSNNKKDRNVTKVTQITTKPISFTAFQALWIPGTTRICVLGSNDSGFGVIQLYNLSTTPLSSQISIPSTKSTPQQQLRLTLQSETEKKTQFKSGTFKASSRSSTLPHLLTGDFEGRVGLWDLSRAEVPIWMFTAHEDVVNCMDGAGSRTGRPEFVTGGRDGTVKLWDMRQDHRATGTTLAKPLSSMASLKRQIEGHDVWCINMIADEKGNSDELLVVAGYDNGDLRVMDLRMGRAIFEINLGHGVCSVELGHLHGAELGSPILSSLVATTLEGSMHNIDLVNGHFMTASTISTAGTVSKSDSETTSMTEEVVSVQSGDDSTLWQIRHVPQQPSIFAVTDGGGYVHL
ncbi:hypothetical protein FBU30_010891 [Linnemannia zychae]|nr:hypothetical protein FBU30_010891 [Linnemannia zychae]